jgi:glycosyltransferase involved in cell wall biosynthesis
MSNGNFLDNSRSDLTVSLKNYSDEQISIIIVHKDRPEYLNLCLQSICVTSFNSNYEIIVVDNGSDKESQAFLDEIEGTVKVIKNEKNLYWSAACNKGANAADRNSKYLIFMHCDIVITNPSWLDLLLNVSESTGSGFIGLDTQTYTVGNQDVGFVMDHMIMMTRDCWSDIGPWPEELPQIGTSFVMTMKAQSRGHKPQIMRTPVLHHYKIFSLGINEYEKLQEEAVSVLPRLVSQTQSRPL